MILLIGAELVKTSIGKILHPADVECTAATILVLLASILVKLWLAHFNRTLGKKISSPALMATGGRQPERRHHNSGSPALRGACGGDGAAA